MTDKDKCFTLWYQSLEGKDYNFVGKKNANLGEMLKNEIRVSPGFALTLHANDVFITESGIKKELDLYLKSLGEVTLKKSIEASKFAIDLVLNSDIPSSIKECVFEDYDQLCEMSKINDVPVAVRSSGSISMPGQMETYLNIRGKEDLLKYIKLTWASAYAVEAITYRMNKGMGFLLNIGVGIPKMVHSRISGVIFTLNPLNGDPSKISVDVSYGLGEAVVSGLVTPDNYLVDKVTLEVIKSTIGTKEVECVYREDGSDIETKAVSEDRKQAYCITDSELKELCRVAKAIDAYYGKPYDIEFGVDRDLPFPQNIIILQVRPESVWSKKKAETKTKVIKDPMSRIASQLVSGIRIR
jgi:pyruvate, water dikinase